MNRERSNKNKTYTLLQGRCGNGTRKYIIYNNIITIFPHTKKEEFPLPLLQIGRWKRFVELQTVLYAIVVILFLEKAFLSRKNPIHIKCVFFILSYFFYPSTFMQIPAIKCQNIRKALMVKVN